MGNVVISVPADGEIPLGSGLKMVKGTLKFATYATGGDLLNLSNYLLSTDVPFVAFGGGDNIAGTAFFAPAHDGGTVASGKVRLFGICRNATDGLAEVNNSLDCSSMNVPFMAIGRGF